MMHGGETTAPPPPHFTVIHTKAAPSLPRPHDRESVNPSSNNTNNHNDNSLPQANVGGRATPAFLHVERPAGLHASTAHTARGSHTHTHTRGPRPTLTALQHQQQPHAAAEAAAAETDDVLLKKRPPLLCQQGKCMLMSSHAAGGVKGSGWLQCVERREGANTRPVHPRRPASVKQSLQ